MSIRNIDFRQQRVTIVGARGFIGRAIVDGCRARQVDYVEYSHDNVPLDTDLGTVVYCSGVAFGAEEEPVRAFDLHVISPFRLLERARYHRFVYLSSTKVYENSDRTDEDAMLRISPASVSNTYAATKAAGEALVLSASQQNRVVRLSNVYGPSIRSRLFLSDILHQAVSTGQILIRTSLDSAKDYIAVEDVAECVLAVARTSEKRIYNVASGRNTMHREIIEAMQSVLPLSVVVNDGAPTQVATPIDVARLRDEFSFTARSVVEDMPALVQAYRNHWSAK